MCTYASGPSLFTNPTAKQNLIALVEPSWGMGSRILADMLVPGIDAVPRSVFARFQRRAATAEVAAGYMRQLYEADATPSSCRWKGLPIRPRGATLKRWWPASCGSSPLARSRMEIKPEAG